MSRECRNGKAYPWRVFIRAIVQIHASGLSEAPIRCSWVYGLGCLGPDSLLEMSLLRFWASLDANYR